MKSLRQKQERIYRKKENFINTVQVINVISADHEIGK